MKTAKERHMGDVDNALRAINRLYYDQEISFGVMRKSLKALRGEIDDMLASLEEQKKCK